MAENTTSLKEQYKNIFESTCCQIKTCTLKKTALIDAVRYDTDHGLLALAIIEAGVDVNITDDSNKTALFYAGYNRPTEDKGLIIAQKLIAAGADVNIIDDGGKTALFFAVKNRNVQVVRALIDAGADVNTLNKNGKTALFYAGANQSGEISKALIEAGADVNVTNNQGQTVLYNGIRSKNENMIRALVEAGADVNKSFINTEQATLLPLTYAILCKDENVILALAETANLNLTDNKGKTALFYAVIQNNNESVVRTLIDAGADVNISDNEGETALFYAVQQSNNERVVRTLIDAGADVNITDDEGIDARISITMSLAYSGTNRTFYAL